MRIINLTLFVAPLTTCCMVGIVNAKLLAYEFSNVFLKNPFNPETNYPKYEIELLQKVSEIITFERLIQQALIKNCKSEKPI